MAGPPLCKEGSEEFFPFLFFPFLLTFPRSKLPLLHPYSFSSPKSRETNVLFLDTLCRRHDYHHLG